MIDAPRNTAIFTAMPEITTKCTACGGSGKTPLSAHLKEALNIVGRYCPDAAVSDMASFLGITPTAMCNRLASLVRLGLIHAKQDGKRKLYNLGKKPVRARKPPQRQNQRKGGSI